MENNKVATVREGGVSQDETESLPKRLTILTGKDAEFLKRFAVVFIFQVITIIVARLLFRL